MSVKNLVNKIIPLKEEFNIMLFPKDGIFDVQLFGKQEVDIYCPKDIPFKNLFLVDNFKEVDYTKIYDLIILFDRNLYAAAKQVSVNMKIPLVLILGSLEGVRGESEYIDNMTQDYDYIIATSNDCLKYKTEPDFLLDPFDMEVLFNKIKELKCLKRKTKS